MNETSNDMLVKIFVGIAVTLVLGLMSWVGITLQTMQIQQSRFDEKLDSVIQKTSEIVPRSENERRYTNLERSAEQNASRISRLEEMMMTQNRR
jgi:uncharacterized protein HemX